MKVTRLPRDPGQSGWVRILPDAPPPTPLDGAETADWLVIGAGFAGLAAARRLSERAPGDRIALIDASRVGEGPAGRNSGFMIDLPHDLTSDNYGGAVNSDRAETHDNRLGIDFAASMAEAFGLGPEAFARTGKINAAASESGHAQNLSYAGHLAAMGEACEMLDAAQMREMTGTGYYRSGLRTPGAAMIQPAMFVRGVAQGLKSNRVRLYEDSPVTGLSRQGPDWVAETAGGRITVPRVVLAVNGHLESFGHYRGRLIHVHTYASMTRALTRDEVAVLGGAARWGVTPADPMGTTVRRISGTGGDRIVVRNRFTYDPELSPARGWETAAARAHDRAFAARFPMLADVGMEYRWGGRLCLSWNNVQIVRQLDKGLYSACCQNGLGTAKGTLAGMLAADLATGHRSEALDRVTAAPPPTRLPPRPLAKIGATARIRWDEWRAGAEL